MLRSMRFGEADRILHLYTPHRGRVGAIAKGVRARAQPLRRPPGAVLPRRTSCCTRAAADLLTVTERRDRERRTRGCATDGAALDCAARACDAVARLFDTAEPQPARSSTCSANELALLDAEPARRRRRANQLAFRLKLLLAAGLAPQLGAVRDLRRARAPRRVLRRRRAAWSATACEAGSSRSAQEAHAFMADALGPAAGRGRRPPPSARCARPSARSPRRSSTTRTSACAHAERR